MRFRGVLFVTLFVGAVAVELENRGEAQKAPSKADLEAGQAVYVDQCQSCHGDHGQGNPKSYKKVGAKVVHLGSKEAQEKPDQFIRDSIVKGWGKMEKCDEVTPEQIDKVIAYVRTLKLPAESK